MYTETLNDNINGSAAEATKRGDRTKRSLVRLLETAISLYSAISPKTAIYYRRFRRYSTYPSILGDTKGCIGRPESATPEFDKRQYIETFHLVF